MTSPRLRFQSSKTDVQFWYDLVVNPVFLRGLDAAMLQLLHELPPSSDPVGAAANFNLMMGARNLRRVMLGLPEVAKERPQLPDDNLKQPK